LIADVDGRKEKARKEGRKLSDGAALRAILEEARLREKVGPSWARSELPKLRAFLWSARRAR
jgi:hypothetical protein